MEKQEFLKKLHNTKIYLKGYGEETFMKLKKFSEVTWVGLGYSLSSLELSPFLYISWDLNVTIGTDMKEFKQSDYEEIPIEFILDTVISEGAKLNPFDKVLVRDEDDEEWSCDFFSHIEEIEEPSETGFYYVTVGGSWYQCIPFEGNESLVGKL